MPVAYLIEKRSKRQLASLREKANPVIVFESRPDLGPWFAERNVTVLSLDPAKGDIVFRTPMPALYRPKHYAIANYLLWRKFMIRYHFIEGSYRRKYKNRRSTENFELRQMRSIVENNRNPGRALELMDLLEAEILEGALTMANRFDDLDREEESRLRLMLRLVRAMHYTWFASRGWDERLASLYQAPALYTAMKYALDFGYDLRDFRGERPTTRALRILVRLFNERVVHAPVDPRRHREELQRWIDGLSRKELGPSDYVFGRPLCF